MANGAVRKRGNGYQADRNLKPEQIPAWANGKARLRPLFDTESAAYGWLADVDAALANGRPVPEPRADQHGTRPGKLSLKAAGDQFWKDEYSFNTSGWGDTAELYVGIIVNFFGATEDAAIIANPAELARFHQHLQEAGNAQSTINGKLSVYSKFCKWLKEHRHTSDAPKVKRKRPDNERLTILTLPEEAMILALARQWEKHDEADAFTVLVDTGLRPSELWRMDSADVQFLENNVTPIMIPKSKNGVARIIYATRRVRDILARRTLGMENGQGKFFAGMSNRRARGVWDRIRTHMKRDEDKDFVVYILRHTCASRLVQRGTALGVVMRWLGHKNIQMTMRYAKYAPTNFLQAVSVLEQPEGNVTVLHPHEKVAI